MLAVMVRCKLGAASLLVALGACAGGPGTTRNEAVMPQGEALHRALLGTWCNSNDGGARCWAHDELLPDGRLRACGRHEDEAQPFAGEGVVSVQGRRLCYRVTAASPNFWLRPGQDYCTEIVSIGPREHVYRDIDTGALFTLLRRDNAAGICPPLEGVPPAR